MSLFSTAPHQPGRPRVPTGYQQTPRGSTSRRFAFSPVIATPCVNSASLAGISGRTPRPLISRRSGKGTRIFEYSLSLVSSPPGPWS
jgi:hypothetical protein